MLTNRTVDKQDFYKIFNPINQIEISLLIKSSSLINKLSFTRPSQKKYKIQSGIS